MGVPPELLARLIEGQVAVGADAEDLNGHVTVGNDLLELGDVGVDVPGALGNVGVLLVDVDVVEEVAVHKVAVALVVGGLQTDILIQVHRVDLGKVQTLLPAATGQLLVHAHRAGAGGEPQTAGGVIPDDLFHNIRGAGALLRVVLGDDYFHKGPPLKNLEKV